MIDAIVTSISVIKNDKRTIIRGEYMAKTNINNQLKVLTKVLEAGFKTEKEILSMTVDKMLSIPNITVPDIAAINELQKAVKSNKVITFLGGEKDNQQTI